MPIGGKIKAFAVNFENGTPNDYKCHVAVYGITSPYQSAAVALSGNTANSRLLQNLNLTFLPRDYIGVFVEDASSIGGNPAPPIVIEASVFLEL